MTANPETHIAALSLGGNTGDVASAFAAALKALSAQGQMRIQKISQVWRTPPWGKTDQPDFLNMAALVETTLTPQDLLAFCLSIEKAAGRARLERWGPRTLDIDIISYDDAVIAEADLTVPHPRAHERAFVLVPLAEIAPDIRLVGKSIADLAREIDRTGMTPDADATRRINSF